MVLFRRNKNSYVKKSDCSEHHSQLLTSSLKMCRQLDEMIYELTERVELLEKVIGCSTALRLHVMKRNIRSKRAHGKRGIFNKKGR